jgi:hypothetical protein
MPHPKFKFLIPNTTPWRKLRKDEQRRRRRVNADGQTRLVPGPLPDPDLERCLCNTSTLLTEREHNALLKLKPKDMTKSTFLRKVVCLYLESTRRKDLPTMSFVDWFARIGNPAKGVPTPEPPPQGGGREL